MVFIRAYYKSSWLVIRKLEKSSNLFNRMGIISEWSTVLITDAKSIVKSAKPLYTYIQQTWILSQMRDFVHAFIIPSQ